MIPNAVCDELDKKIGSKTALDSPKLKEAEAILKLSKALGAKFLQFYVYGVVEGDALVMYLSHPAMVMEFRGQKSRVLEEMRTIYAKEEMRGVVTFKDVRVAVKVKPAPILNGTEVPAPDRARGDFEIHCKDDALRKAFEGIRKTIREGHDGNSRT